MASLRRYLESSPLPHLPWAFSIMSKAAPLETVVLTMAAFARRLGPVAVLFVLQRVIDTVSAGHGADALTGPLVTLMGVLAVVEALNAWMGAADGRSWEKVSTALTDRIITCTSTLPMAAFDRPETHDMIERVTQHTAHKLYGLCYNAIFLVATVAGAMSALALLATASPVIALIAILVALPIAWVGVRQGRRLFQLTTRQSPGRRFTQYLGGLLSRREAATELRAYQLVGYFLDKWRRSWATRRADHLDVRWMGVKEGWLASVVAVALFAGAMAALTFLAGRGQIGPGQIVVLIGAVRILQDAMTHAAQIMGWLWEEGLPVAEMHRFLQNARPERPEEEGVPFPKPVSGGIRFEHVSFRYPGSQEAVLEDVTFAIAPGEKVALVGENGAGKSTLVKLLLGLYQPTGGRITVDGVDLQQIAPASLRANLSCVFQDFVRYDMTLADNIRMGRLGAPAEDVIAAYRAAGLVNLVESLPKGTDTMLGRTFDGGVDLSGGQWQRVALARAFVRQAQVIVLDEPTAALDPRAELEVFGKFVELVQGRTAVLISHRLGSARLADRVIVLGEGLVLETGSHDQLMAAGGHYAELFQTQAQWYNDSASAEEAAV